jgi:hypothetical protein
MHLNQSLIVQTLVFVSKASLKRRVDTLEFRANSHVHNWTVLLFFLLIDDKLIVNNDTSFDQFLLDEW